MKNNATIPVMAIAAIALIAFLVYWGKKNLSGPEAVSTKDAGLPSFIDPATQKPKGMSPAGGGSGTTASAPKPPGPGGRPGAAPTR